jgi:hypothetical protein
LKTSLKRNIKEFFSPKGAAWLLSPGLTNQGEAHVIRNLELYVSAVSESMLLLRDVVSAYAKANEREFWIAMDEIAAISKDAESIRWDTFSHIANKRLFFPESRESMLHLINTVNHVFFLLIDLRIIVIPKEPLKPELIVQMDTVTEIFVKTANILSSAIKYLNSDVEHVIEISRQVANNESEIFVLIERVRSNVASSGPEEVRIQILEFLMRLLKIHRALIISLNQIQEIAIKFI